MEEARQAGSLSPGNSPAAAQSTKTLETALIEPYSTRRRGGAQKRKANSSNSASNTTPSKRLAREKASNSFLPPTHNGRSTRTRQAPSNLAPVAEESLAGSVQGLVEQAVKEEPDARESHENSVVVGVKNNDDNCQALESMFEAEFESIRSRGANVHVVPTHCGWFSWSRVHPIEEHTLQSFFNAKFENRTSDIYLEIRNWIMRKYHANPNTLIELKDLSELTGGDMDMRQEVMEFLDHWGLINFHPFLAPNIATDNADDESSEIKSLVDKLYHFETVQPLQPVTPRANMATSALPSGLFPETAIAEELARPEGPSVEYHCNSCSADCSRKRYHCQKQADFDLCTDCFNSWKFDSDMSSSDFILMEPAEVLGVGGGNWTDQETLLLLEALELYNENWNEIAEHVATKTKAQCILHFVQMPIEDSFINNDDEIDASVQEDVVDPLSTDTDPLVPKDVPETKEIETDASERQKVLSSMDTSKPINVCEVKDSQRAGENIAVKALREAFEAIGSSPETGYPHKFAETGNPVMALAGFLTRLVSHDVATASAHFSLKSMSSSSPGMQLAARHCFVLEDPPSDKVEAASESALSEVTNSCVQTKEKKQIDSHEIRIPVSDLGEREALIEDGNKKKEDLVQEGELTISPVEGNREKSGAAEEQITSTREVEGEGICSESSRLNTSIDPPSNSMVNLDCTAPEAHLRDHGVVGESGQPTEAEKEVNVVTNSHPLETEPQQIVASNSTDGVEGNTGEGKTNGSNNKSSIADETKERNNEIAGGAHLEESREKKDNSTDIIKHVDGIDRLKRAAMTALSSAAVKAKLLANQEEDQIRQLATLLIEKQLHKLETKLAFFDEMECLIMRGREQLERFKQRLYQERAQIIAARFGAPPPSVKGAPPHLVANRTGTNFANPMPRPQRPPGFKPAAEMGPLSSSSYGSAAVAGSSVRQSGPDNPSPVGMK